jgi:ABC-type antimicrobial peptide transport system permease subunit
MNDKAKHNLPPSWPTRILEWFCSPVLIEEMQGDLLELYSKWTKKFGTRKAKYLYVLQAIKFLRLYSLKSISTNHNSVFMIRNYMTFAFRHLKRSKTFSLINICGLVLGLASSLIIYLWVEDEKRIDNFHERGNQLYRVYLRQFYGEEVYAGYNTPALLPETLKEEIPEVEYASGFAKVLRLSQQGDTYESFQVGDRIYKMRGSRAGEDFFSMFSYPLLAGTPESALNHPSGIAISRKMANLFFGSPEQAFGSTLKFSSESNSREVGVTAVFEDLPSYSSDQFDYLTNWDYWVEHDDFKKYWGHKGTYTYIQLRAGSDPLLVETKLKGFLNKFLPEDTHQLELGLQRYGDQYLNGNFENGRPAGGRAAYVRSMTIVAIFVLVIACVNFMNLSTAGSLRRSREVGIRKAAGAHRWNLVAQFMGETFLLASISIALSLLLAWLALPWFNTLTEKQLVLPLYDLTFLWKALLLLIAVGFAAGSYPALFLSAFQPSRALKGTVKINPRTAGLGKGLVVFQFSLSILLIIITLVVSMQTSYIRNKNIGYNRENILCVRLEGALIHDYKTLKNEAMRMPGIHSVDRSSQTPHTMGFIGPFVRWNGMDPEHEVHIIPNSVGFDYVKLMGLKIVEGRDFSEDFPADSASFIISESAVQQMKLKDPVGNIITVFGKTGPIVGVVNDFNAQSLHHGIMPIVIDIKEDLNFGTILLKTKAGQTEEAINSLRQVYSRLNPGYAFSYSFLDDAYQRLYFSEQIISKLSSVFGGLSIFISCLGLLGLAVFAAEQRTREMGIRKVLGASVTQIFALFSKGFMTLVCVAIVLAVPVAWLVASGWLSGFAYRIDLTWWIFVAGGVLALVLALLTISTQAISTGLRNPVETLRSE